MDERKAAFHWRSGSLIGDLRFHLANTFAVFADSSVSVGSSSPANVAWHEFGKSEVHISMIRSNPIFSAAARILAGSPKAMHRSYSVE
jgi:hypothetical protein